MRILYVVLILIFLLMLYLLYQYFTAAKPLTGTHPATSTITIDESKTDKTNNASNCTYSIWFYISDWNYRYGEPKMIFDRKNNAGDTAISANFDALQNNVNIDVMTYATTDGTSAGTSNVQAPAPVLHQCTVDNVPLQRWVNLLVSVYGRSMDVYIDGKLVRTCVLPGLADVSSNKPITITGGGGFQGFTSKFRYYTTPTNPQQAWNIYKEGFGGSMFGSLLNRYRIKVSFLDNNKPTGSYEF